MAMAPPQSHLYSSPKRKRGELETQPYHHNRSVPQASALITSFRKYPFPPTDSLDESSGGGGGGGGSPRSTVARQFQSLAIRGDLERPKDNAGEWKSRKRFAQMTTVEHSAETASPPESLTPTPSQEHEVPHHPNLDPSKSDTPSSSSSSSSSSAAISERPRQHSRSPPLDGDAHENYWHESEITGHNPSDPSDDGYGINGIGFKPTPAMAWARSQKRKQQLAEYKNREAREARQRRSERRREPPEDGSGTAAAGPGPGPQPAPGEVGVEGSPGKKSARVRFEDG